MVPSPMATKYIISHKSFEKTQQMKVFNMQYNRGPLSHSSTGTALLSK